MLDNALSLKELVLALHRTGAIKFGEFRLQVHDDWPGAPLSPFYVNLRTSDNKGGPLTDHLVLQIAYRLAELLDQEYPAAWPTLCGLPQAGEPFVNALEAMRGAHSVKLVKRYHEDGTRSIEPPDPSDWPELSTVSELALIDDVVTRAGSKIMGIDAGSRMGFVVRHVFVFLDRGNGAASSLLEERNVIVHSALNDKLMFGILHQAGKITRGLHDHCLGYRHDLEEYILEARRSLELSDSDSDL